MRKFLISLAKDIQRRELFFSQPDTADFEVFDAVNMMQMPQQEIESLFDLESFKQHYQRNATKGEVGCTLSHLEVYKRVMQDPNIAEDDYVLVCEDDALLCENFQQHLTALLQQNPNSDIIWLGQSKIAKFNDIELELNYPTSFNFMLKKIVNSQYYYCYPYRNYFAGTVAYLIKKSACISFWQEINQGTSIYWLADDFILFEQKLALDIMAIRPLMVIENPNLASNLELARASVQANLFSKVIKYPLKKLMAIKRNL